MLLIALLTFLAIALAFGFWFWWACATPTSTFFRPVLVRGPRDRKQVTLTFDDGPAEMFTDQILDVLREHRAPGTFFVCGRNVEKRPEILKRIVAEGHAVGNHTLTHPYLFFKSRRLMAEEIDRTQEIIERVVGFRPKIFRPPYGSRWFGLVPTLEARGMKLIQWSAMGYDWVKDAEGIVASVLKQVHPGAVILLHDGRETRDPSEVDRAPTVKALPEIIRSLRSQGYEFVPLSNFLPNAS
jgi:peptidoglycan/xylan/chitin deacetylase (PgdA/CDA1 family)